VTRPPRERRHGEKRFSVSRLVVTERGSDDVAVSGSDANAQLSVSLPIRWGASSNVHDCRERKVDKLVGELAHEFYESLYPTLESSSRFRISRYIAPPFDARIFRSDRPC
jgi:hypothetical protein